MQAFWLLTLMAISATTWGDEGAMTDCSSIERDLERLSCYDERAAEDGRRQERDAADVTAPMQAPRAAADTTRGAKPGAVAEPRIDAAEPAVVKAESAVVEPEPTVPKVEAAVVETELPVAVEEAAVTVEAAIAVDGSAAATSTIAVVEPVVAKAEPRQDSFGRRAAGPARGTQRAAHIESIRRAPLGHHIMTLSNGQIWAENEPGVRRIKAGQDVTIVKVRFRYDMRLESGRSVAVHRVEND